MRKMKYLIGILLLFMVIGFATVTVSLSLSGNARLTGDIGDFKVYFSDVKMNDEQNLRLVKSETEIIFDVLLQEIGTTYKISYDVTNASSMFDANLSVSCTQGDEYVSVINDFDSSTLPALTTRTGDLTIKKLKAYGSDTNKDYTITCSIVASPVERDSQASGEVISPIKPLELSIGDVISIAGENFNVISQTDTTVTMLAQYNLGTDYRQSTTENYVTFSSDSGWWRDSEVITIDLPTYAPEINTYINNYNNYIVSLTGNSSVFTTLITIQALGQLGCDITNVANLTSLSCVDSFYKNWLFNNQYWWTKSGTVTSGDYVWMVYNENALFTAQYGGQVAGIRPVITVPIELARKYYVGYEVGRIISIADENFNVISDNGDTITMLAQYNLGTDYRQSSSAFSGPFADASGWEYTPGQKEIDIQIWSTNPKNYVNEYVYYLQGEIGNTTLSGDLITISNLISLGCGNSTCKNSEYSSWLVSGQFWWTRTASSSPDYVYHINHAGTFALNSYSVNAGIRPVITIPKELYN